MCVLHDPRPVASYFVRRLTVPDFLALALLKLFRNSGSLASSRNVECVGTPGVTQIGYFVAREYATRNLQDRFALPFYLISSALAL